jgi:hypothetical protein
MKASIFITMAIFTSLLSSCNLSNEKPDKPISEPSPDARYSYQDLDSLLSYGDELAKLNENERLVECSHLKELGQTEQNLGWVLHLMLVQVMTDNCGDRRETLSKLKLTLSLIKDERTRQFIAIQEQILLRMEKKLDYTTQLNRQLKFSKQKIQKSHREIKTQENEIKSRESELKSHDNEMKTRDTEMKRLQNKLNLLKSIENNLGNNPKGELENPKTGK